MTLHAPFGQHVYVGQHATTAAALTWIQARHWDTNGDGSGDPYEGMWALIGASAPYVMWVYTGSAWVQIAEAGGSVVAHDMGGSSHVADTLSDISAKCSDDGLVGLAAVQTLTNKTLTAPTIGDFTNAAHDHSDAEGGAQISHGSLSGVGATDHHSNANDPSSDEKAALAGTGTPSGSNLFVTYDTLVSASQGLDPKGSVLVIATTNQTLSGFPTIDGIGPLGDEDRVLCTAQTDPVENGIWETRVGAWTRPPDFATGDPSANSYLFAREGAVYADTGWVCTTNSPDDIIDTDSLAFAQFTGAGQITAGTGLTKDGNTLHVGDGTVEKRGAIDFTADDIAVAYDGASLDLDGLGNLQIADSGVRKRTIHGDVAGLGIAQAAGGELNADPANTTVVSGHAAGSEAGVSVSSNGIFSAVTYAGNPNGVVTAPGGMICRDTLGGITYVNVDGATAWSVI